MTTVSAKSIGNLHPPWLARKASSGRASRHRKRDHRIPSRLEPLWGTLCRPRAWLRSRYSCLGPTKHLGEGWGALTCHSLSSRILTYSWRGSALFVRAAIVDSGLQAGWGARQRKVGKGSFARGDLGALIVATSPDASISVGALKKGMHVLCEKLLARTFEEARAVVAEVAGRVLKKCGFNYRARYGICGTSGAFWRCS